jgi:hypothetical protein
MTIDTHLYLLNLAIFTPIAAVAWLVFRRSMHSNRSSRFFLSVLLAVAAAPTGWQNPEHFRIYPAAPMLLFMAAGEADSIRFAALFALLPITCLAALIFFAFSLPTPHSRTT